MASNAAVLLLAFASLHVVSAGGLPKALRDAGNSEDVETCCKGVAYEEIQGAGYVFAGFGNASVARDRCSKYGGLPMPKTPGEQRLLIAAMRAATKPGRLEGQWPHNTIWMGGHWAESSKRWKWDDGSVISHQMLPIAPSSPGEQRNEPFLCFPLGGVWEDAAPLYEFGILCSQTKRDTTSLQPPRGLIVMNSSAVGAAAASADLARELVPGETNTTGKWEEKGCFKEEVAWEPLNMPNVQLPIILPDEEACQKQCANTTGCAHFSFWKYGKHCYLQDFFAIPTEGRIGFVSGPFKCFHDLDHTRFAKVVDQAYLHRALGCVELGTMYSPIIALPKYFADAPGGREAAKACKRYCASVEGCAHWTMNMADKHCSLTGKGAMRTTSAINFVSGPPACGGRPSKVPSLAEALVRASLPADLRLGGGSRHSSLLTLFADFLLVAGITATTLMAYRCMRMQLAPVSSQDIEGSESVAQLQLLGTELA